jgi:hypothetical protein
MRTNNQNLPSNFGGEIAQILEKKKYYCSQNGIIDGWGEIASLRQKKSKNFLGCTLKLYKKVRYFGPGKGASL